MNLIIAAVLFFILFALTELLVKSGAQPKNTRRFAHMTAGFLAFFLPYFLNFTEVIILGIFFTVFLALTKRWQHLKSIHEIRRKSLGAILFPAGLLVSAVLFWKMDPQLFQVSVLVLSLSDSLAGMIGEKFGKHKYCITGQKTIEGSIAFFITTLLIFIGLLRINNTLSPEKCLLVFVASFVLTVVEGVLGGGIDNLIIPVATGLLGALFL